MELSKQEIESFLQFPVIGSKNFFNKRFAIKSNDSKMDKQKIELSQQEMELFLPFWAIVSKNLFNNRFLIWSNYSKIVFRNRKLNYLKRKWNHFSFLQSLDQKTSLTKDSSFSPTIPKLINRKWNCLNRKWNYFSPFKLWYQKTSLTKDSSFGQIIPKWFSETGNGII